MKRKVHPLETRQSSQMDELVPPGPRPLQRRTTTGLGSGRLDYTDSMIQSYDECKSRLIEHVQSHIKRKECIHFVPKRDPKRKPGTPIYCHCGEVPEKHIKGTAGVTEFFQKGISCVEKELEDPESTASKKSWTASSDITELATNAFGKIEFINESLGGMKPSKFVRLSDTTPVDEVLSLMVDHWHMQEPRHANLVITVIGGAKNFKLDGKKKEVFNQGLIKAAQTTAAWIITSGFNMGVMKAVGEAVQEGQTYMWDSVGLTHTLRCIGIAPWGYVERHDVLVSKDGAGTWNASYKVNTVIRHGHPVSLNPNHTHFLLVDDGFRGRYGGVADFRASLERKISLPANGPGETGLGIPVVLVVVEGGYDAILDVQMSLSQGIPVVICEGTGRAANIIAYAYTHYKTTRKGERIISAKHKLILEDKLQEAFGKTWAQRANEQEEMDKFMEIIKECCQDEKLITVFDLNKNDDLDQAILSALLKGQGATELSQLRDQLQLALTWDRCDIASEKIFSDNITWPTGYLDDIMTEALIGDKVNFVRLLLQNGVVMKEYLTVPRLRKLYNSAPRMSHLRELLEKRSQRGVFLLKDVHSLLRRLVGKHYNDIYKIDDDFAMVMRDEYAYKGHVDIFERPFQELFLWAVLMRRQELALFLWERDDEPVATAIMASYIYGKLGEQVAHYDHDMRNLYMANKRELEIVAVRVLEIAHNMDPEKAEMLIERKHPTWGDMTCLQMAAEANNEVFLSSVCCQNSLNILWKRGISSSRYKILAALAFPILIFTRVRFHEEKLSPFRKFITFYQAPITKFASHVIMYMCFLVLYSYMLLFSIRDPPTVVEFVVVAWMLSFAIEEFKSMLMGSNADTLKQRVRDWWFFSIYNRLNLLMMFLSVVAVGLRFNPDYIREATTVYAINCVFSFIRLLRDYSASSSLGPKLVMITKMFQELILYITILMVVLLAYGVSTQALMFPGREYYGAIFRDIFYYPYWQIYGELYLEELEGTTTACQGNLTSAQMATCPQYSWLVLLLTAVYLLVGNILLLNLLIAIFNHVFEEVEMNSIQIWKFGIYFLVVNCYNKPCLAPPFSIVEHVFLAVRWMCRKVCCTQKVKAVQYSERQLELLQIYEREMLRLYIRQKQQQDRSSTDASIYRILHRVEEMAKMLEEERFLEQQHYEATRNLQRDLDSSLSLANSVESLSTSSQRPFSRWPTLDRIKELKKDLEIIHEDPHTSTQTSHQGAPQRIDSTDDDSCQNLKQKVIQNKMHLPNFADNMNHEGMKNDLMKGTADVLGEWQGARKYEPLSMDQTEVDGVLNYDEEKIKRKKKKKKKRKFSRETYLEEGMVLNHDHYNPVSSEEEGDRSTVKARRRLRREQKLLNISPPGSSTVEQMDARLVNLEQSTERKLYNIESLLRSAVFTRSVPSTPNCYGEYNI